MLENIENLFAHLQENENPELLKKVAILFCRYRYNSEVQKYAEKFLTDTLSVDLNELESLVNPEKFQFPDPDLGLIGVENENQTAQ